MTSQQWKKIAAVNVGAVIGCIGALFLLPATALGLPLVFAMIGFYGLVNFIAVPKILMKSNSDGKPLRKGIRWQPIVMWICVILGIIIMMSARR
jgi:hypothetical protein